MAVCEYCWVTTCVLSIEFHAVFHPGFYNPLMISQKLLSLSLILMIHLCFIFISFLTVLYTLLISHFISPHIIFHLSALVLNPVFFNLSHFLPYFLINLLVLFSTFYYTFALLPFSSFITKIKDVCCDPSFLSGLMLTKYFSCIFCHCCIKCRHSTIDDNIRVKS